MDASDVTVVGFQLGHLLLAFLITATFIFILYWLWTWPCGATRTGELQEVKTKKYNTVLPVVKPLYALELEPGIVVLQSEDGEFFRILREYEAVDKTGHGCQSPELANCAPDNQYIPTYTRAHYQTRPSAPFLSETDNSVGNDPFGDGGRWTPINTLNSHSQ